MREPTLSQFVTSDGETDEEAYSEAYEAYWDESEDRYEREKNDKADEE